MWARRVGAGMLVVAAFACATTSSAHAAKVKYVNGVLSYGAAPGEANRLIVDLDGSDELFVFRDAGATLHAGRGCTGHPDGSATCGTTDPWPATLRVYLNDESDTAHLETLFVDVAAWGQRGDDVITAGSGSPGYTVLFGGAGDDVLATSVNHGGGSDLRGEDGDDQLFLNEGGYPRFDGGAGDDQLRLQLWDGGGRLRGGPGDDRYSLTWSGSGQTDPGPSVVRPGPGVDTLELTGDYAGGNDLDLNACHGCVERVLGSPDGDTIRGTAAAETIEGLGGDDTIDPRGGADDVSGGDGGDRILTRDGVRDTVACGSGIDLTLADPLDELTADCEGAA